MDRHSGCSDFCILVQMMLCKDPCTYLFAHLYKAWRRSPTSPIGVSSPLLPPGSFQMKSKQPRCFRQRLYHAKDPPSKTFCGGPGGGRARVAWQGGGSHLSLHSPPGLGEETVPVGKSGNPPGGCRPHPGVPRGCRPSHRTPEDTCPPGPAACMRLLPCR